MSYQFIVFPEPLDAKCELRLDDNGLVILGVPAVHPAGRPGQGFTIPDGTPDGHGAGWTTTPKLPKVPVYLHGTLELKQPLCSFDVDTVVCPQKPASSPLPLEALHAQGGRYLRTVSGRHVPWRGITGFQVIERVSTQMAEAEDFLDFCAEHRAFPRALVMAKHLFKLAPEQGLEALPTYLDMVKARGLYTEVVSLADTRSYEAMNFDAHTASVGQACAKAGCAINELGNELLPIHSTQSDKLTPDRLMQLARLVSGVPVSLGSTHGPDAESREFAELAKRLPNGYATAHDIRTDEENWWKWVRHPNDLGWIADDVRIFLSSNEAQKVDMTPGKHLGTAAVCRVIRAIGDTFHYDEGRYARRPTGGELQAFLGRVQGWNLVPDEWIGQYRNAGQGWPVRGFQDGNRCYSSVNHANGNEAYSVALDSDAMRIEWYDDAKPELIVERNGTRVFRVTR